MHLSIANSLVLLIVNIIECLAKPNRRAIHSSDFGCALQSSHIYGFQPELDKMLKCDDKLCSFVDIDTAFDGYLFELFYVAETHNLPHKSLSYQLKEVISNECLTVNANNYPTTFRLQPCQLEYNLKVLQLFGMSGDTSSECRIYLDAWTNDPKNNRLFLTANGTNLISQTDPLIASLFRVYDESKSATPLIDSGAQSTLTTIDPLQSLANGNQSSTQTTKTANADNMWMIAIIVVAVMLVLLIIVVIVCIWPRRKKKKSKIIKQEPDLVVTDQPIIAKTITSDIDAIMMANTQSDSQTIPDAHDATSKRYSDTEKTITTSDSVTVTMSGSDRSISTSGSGSASASSSASASASTSKLEPPNATPEPV